MKDVTGLAGKESTIDTAALGNKKYKSQTHYPLRATNLNPLYTSPKRKRDDDDQHAFLYTLLLYSIVTSVTTASICFFEGLPSSHWPQDSWKPLQHLFVISEWSRSRSSSSTSHHHDDLSWSKPSLHSQRSSSWWSLQSTSCRRYFVTRPGIVHIGELVSENKTANKYTVGPYQLGVLATWV